jgi:hypothetical protein
MPCETGSHLPKNASSTPNQTTAMPTLFTRARTLVALALLIPAAAQAERQQNVTLTPLDASHPDARRAAAVVEALAAGDRARAVTLLRQEGDPAWVAGRMETQVDVQIQRLAPAGRWKIAGFESSDAGADVVVQLADGDASNALVVRMLGETPHRITGFALIGGGAPGGSASAGTPGNAASGTPPAPPPLTAEAQRVVIDSVGRLLEAFHVAPDTGRMIADRIRERERAGAYAALTARQAFAQAVTDDMRAVNGDRHLRLFPGRPGGPQQGSGAAAGGGNGGVERAEIMEGNVGYVRLAGSMRPAQDALDAVAAAFRTVGSADAVIVDLRGVPGGSPQMVDWIASHFVAPGTPFVRVYNRREGTDVVRTALAEVDGPRRLEVPLYVLVDEGSASAAEAVPFILQSLGRATIVGARTPGAGRNNAIVDVGSGFAASVTFTRVTDPRTGRGWEAIGIQPDIAVASADALAAAHRDSLRRLGRGAN